MEANANHTNLRGERCRRIEKGPKRLAAGLRRGHGGVYIEKGRI